MDFKTVKFEAAVRDFKQLCAGHDQLFRYGQFYVTRRTIDDLQAQIRTELLGNLRLAGQPDQVQRTIAFFKASLSKPVLKIVADVMIDVLNGIESGGDMASLKALFTPSKNDSANARSDFDAIWSTTAIPGAPLLSSSAPSLGKAQAALAIEKDRCFQVLRSFARKLLKKRGIASLPAPVVISDGTVGNAVIQRTVPATATEAGRQLIRYNAPAALTATVAKMKAALDAGGYVHCGLLSGAVHEHSVFPQPEHHILVFAYDAIEGQDAFLFWDPDATESNIASAGWDVGFGVLFSRTGALTTAIDDADLAGVDQHLSSDTFGDHAREAARHCYQVYSVQTLPEQVTVRLHTKILHPPVRSSIDDMLLNAIGVYAARGIEIIEVSREIVDTAGTDADRFQTLFVGDGRAGTPTAEVTALHDDLRASDRGFGVDPDANDLVVAFVRTLVPAGIGCADHPLEKPGAVLSATLAGEWALANQIGRVLGLQAGADSDLLMFSNTDALTAVPPALSDDDVATIVASPLAEA